MLLWHNATASTGFMQRMYTACNLLYLGSGALPAMAGEARAQYWTKDPLIIWMYVLVFIVFATQGCGAQDEESVLAIAPRQCQPGTNGTTALCHPSCAVCKDTGSNPRKRERRCCKPGWVKTRTQPAQCTPCPLGTFSAGPAMRSCRRCIRGMTTLRRGSNACNGESNIKKRPAEPNVCTRQ